MGDRRLDPRTVALRAISGTPSTLLGLPAFAAVVTQRSAVWIALALAVAAGVALLLGVLRWRAFTYAIGSDALVIADGLFTRTRRSIPLERVQDVSIERTPVARLLGLASVRIETGGGEADDARLHAVSQREAARLRAVLRRMPGAAQAAAPEAHEPPPLFAMGTGRVLAMGAFAFSLVWIGGIAAAVQFVGEAFGWGWDELVRGFGVARGRWGDAGPGAAAALVAAALAVSVGGGFVSTLLAEHGFRLTFEDGRFRRTRGLLTRAEVHAAARRTRRS